MKLGLIRSDPATIRTFLNVGARRANPLDASASRVRGVLLDVDGTLLDSNLAHARAWVEALEGIGISLPVEKVLRLIGMGGDKLLPELTGISSESPVGKAVTEKRKAIFKARHLPELSPLPGARALVERMRADGLSLIVATSAEKEEIAGLLRAAAVGDLIDTEVTSSDADRSKPDPDIVRAAVARAKVSPRELVMLADTPYDIEAASRAGVPVIAMRSGGWSDDDLAGAVAIYDHPADLLAQYESSRLAVGRASGS